MFTQQQHEQFGQVARVSQIIAIALMVGVMVFVAVVLGAGLGPEQPSESPIVAIFSAVASFATAVIAPIMPRLIAARVRRALVDGKPTSQFSAEVFEELGEAGALAGTYQVGQIVYRAILEGAAFMNVAAYMVEGQSFSLALVSFLLIVMAFRFPTRDHLENWISQELTAIDQLRGLGG